MGCEGVYAGNDVKTTIGGVLMGNGDGRRVNDGGETVKSPVPPNSLSSGSSGS